VTAACLPAKEDKAEDKNAKENKVVHRQKMQNKKIHAAAEIRWWSPTQLLRSRY
jgi:hypothetical protein